MLTGHFRPGYLKTLGAIEACPSARVQNNPAPTGEELVCAVADLPFAEFIDDKFVRQIIETNILPEHRCHFTANGRTDRTITEFCCGTNSRLGRRYRCSEGCRVIRITQGLDANSIEGKFIAAKGVAARHGLLFGSIPCTGGCPFNHINGQTESGRANIRKHVLAMIPLLRTFERLCAIAQKCGNFICLEWPAGCAYWRRRDVQRLIEQYGLTVVRFNGCRLQITDPEGRPLAKPWKLATNCPGIIKRFQDLKCRGDHVHAANRGETLKATEDYSYEFVRLIHDGFRESLKLKA